MQTRLASLFLAVVLVTVICIPLLVLARACLADRWVQGPGFMLNGLALAVLGLHVARFFVDFLSTYRFYYPTASLEAAADA